MLQPKLTELRNYLLNKLGLTFSDNQEKELFNKIKAASKSFNFDNTDNFINWLINQELDTEQTKKLASFLTIGETYFFREKKALDYLEFEYLPDLINKRRGHKQCLKIWSAGCASGEEPYSVAILLKRILPDIKNWDITILATDINPEFIKKAQKGVYTKWSFRGISESFKTMNFEKLENDKYRIKSSIKKMVDFSFVNLASDSYPSTTNNTNEIDIILCRNVLIYFSIKGIKSVTSKFYNSLNDNGVLLVSPVESSNLISSKFHQFLNNGISVYLKDAEAALKQKAKHAKIMPIKISGKQKSSASLKPVTKHIEKLRNKPSSKIDVKSEENLVKVSKQTHSEKKTNEPSDYQKALNFYKLGLFDKSEE
jgi:chemotaxis protein methyltransferase CheR